MPSSACAETTDFVTLTRGFRLFVTVQSTTSPAASSPTESGPASEPEASLSPEQTIDDS